MLRYSFIFLFAILLSCGSRKVDVEKTDTVLEVESKSEMVKNETIDIQNNLSINTNIDEIEITPINPDKPIIIGAKEYFNAKIKTKKTKYSVVDTAKISEVKKETKKVESKKNKEEKVKVKNIEKKESFSSYLWWILIVIAIVFFSKKVIKRYLL